MPKKILIISSLSLALAVGLGALGAHFLKEKLTPEHLDSFKTGVSYHFLHSLAIIIVAILMQVFNKPGLKISAYLFIIGIVFFSGSIYVLSTTDLTAIHAPILGPITPLGGLMFIAGWLNMAIQFIKKSS